jgi:hypothetical protein
LHERAYQQADEKGDAGDDFEVEQRFAADAADLLDTIHAGNAAGDRAENDQRDHHRDQPDECIAERTHRLGRGRPHVAKHDRDGDAQQHLAP